MIDRSKPLSIHEFPSLIDGVARLKDLEAKATPGPFFVIELAGCWSVGTSEKHMQANDLLYTGKHDAEMIAALRNSAPKLLDVLSEIRAGDADILDGMATWFACSDDPDQFSRQIEILRRYRDIARKMEAKSE